jgi:hypothetical protein
MEGMGACTHSKGRTIEPLASASDSLIVQGA